MLYKNENQMIEQQMKQNDLLTQPMLNKNENQMIQQQMRQNDRTNNEFYLAPTYNYIEESVGIYRVYKMIGMVTP